MCVYVCVCGRRKQLESSGGYVRVCRSADKGLGIHICSKDSGLFGLAVV